MQPSNWLQIRLTSTTTVGSSTQARAYFLRGAAFGGLGDSHNSLSDIVTALRLDPSLERYVTFKGEDASLTLPP